MSAINKLKQGKLSCGNQPTRRSKHWFPTPARFELSYTVPAVKSGAPALHNGYVEEIAGTGRGAPVLQRSSCCCSGHVTGVLHCVQQPHSLHDPWEQVAPMLAASLLEECGGPLGRCLALVHLVVFE